MSSDPTYTWARRRSDGKVRQLVLPRGTVEAMPAKFDVLGDVEKTKLLNLVIVIDGGPGNTVGQCLKTEGGWLVREYLFAPNGVAGPFPDKDQALAALKSQLVARLKTIAEELE